MQRTPTHPALGFLVLGALLVSSPTTPGQSCSFKPVLQGRVCTKPGAPCKPPTVGSGNGGKCTTEGLHPEELACECQGSPTPSYNITLSPLSPTYIDTDVATSTITVIAFNGFTGKVDFSCTVSGVPHPAPSCANPASATVTNGSATSLRSEEHTSELQSRLHLVCRLLLEKKNANSYLGPLARIRIACLR